MSKKPEIVFLYTEIAEYLLAACRYFVSQQDAIIHIVRYPVNKEAPFQFEDADPNIRLYDSGDYDAEKLYQLVKGIDPSLIICSGWIDKDYLKVCKRIGRTIPTVLAMDTQWTGSMKQLFASIAGRFFLLKRFSHAWVPGEQQRKYARKLGFKEENIYTGYYSCNTPHFNSIYNKLKEAKADHFPKRFIYAGRYYGFKGLEILWQAFIELQNETPTEWELWCLGTGDLVPVQHPKIKHCGFVQPTGFFEYAQNTGVFVMPSLFEPWGVVLHEFAAMGFPLIVSDRVGAGSAFVKQGVNGYIYPAENKAALKEKMKWMMQAQPGQLNEMGAKSVLLSEDITPQKWADTLMKLMRNE